ncbi:hypothetical protein [Paraburkholderia sp. Ac-20347]|uniref:hypothetical protein n=1 Tax=Paraburkholderia sp. Ac-20347 TaxID=2703892 RepID=UPI001980247C|nr:hypothetical protein [Paraburkholderia sp. Ac-20347]MBN3814690.1 hypothetical protein [Paraburkholderia sp. Ac-20347]
MSIRTIIEINHDQLGALKNDPGWWARLLGNLGTSRYGAAINEANADGCPIHLGHGVRLVTQRHHSESAMVKTQYLEIKL